MKLLKRILVDAWGRRDDDFNWRKDQAPLDPAGVTSVLMLHLNGKLGDAIIDSLLIDALARTHPEIPVSVGTTKEYEAYWRAHLHVREVAIFPPSKGRSALARIGPARRAGRRWRGRFDVVVSFESFAQPDHFALLRALRPRVLIGFHKNRFRLFDYSLDEGRHGVLARSIFAKIAAIMRVFGEKVEPESLRFHVPFKESDAERIESRLTMPGPRVYLHTHGSGPNKTLGPDKVREIVHTLREAGFGGGVWVGVPAGRETAYGDQPDVAVVPPFPDAFALFAFLDRMDLIVAPDTSIGHIAAALGKPQIVMFAGETNVPRVWKPLNARCAVLVAPKGDSVEGIDPAAFAEAARTARAWVGEEG